MSKKRPNEKPLNEQSPRMRMLRGDTSAWPNAGEDFTRKGLPDKPAKPGGKGKK